jgi:hypothetical protein
MMTDIERTRLSSEISPVSTDTFGRALDNRGQATFQLAPIVIRHVFNFHLGVRGLQPPPPPQQCLSRVDYQIILKNLAILLKNRANDEKESRRVLKWSKKQEILERRNIVFVVVGQFPSIANFSPNFFPPIRQFE